jgi:hypothetical protein
MNPSRGPGPLRGKADNSFVEEDNHICLLVAERFVTREAYLSQQLPLMFNI